MPKILIIATSHWFPPARLAMALTSVGCDVDAVCPPRHPLSTLSILRHLHIYHGLAPLYSLKQAITDSNPDLIVPGDDLSTRHLHHLYRREQAHGDRGSKICRVIERSFGSPESFPIVYARAKFMRMAEQEGVRTPKTAVIESAEELRQWTQQAGFPTVLKADGTSGGDGVKMVRNFPEAANAYRKLKAPPLMARAAKRALIDHDKTLIWPSLLRRRSTVSAQVFIPGNEATSLVACWEGAVLAQLHFEVINKRDSAGPATVIRLIDHPEMLTAVERMVRKLKLSGIHGFDFMIESHSGNAYLIEINPRTTQVGHLRLGAGKDLPAALAGVLTGSLVQPTPKVTEKTTFTLFPQEWTRDPASPFIQTGYHDVPWEEPGLLQLCIEQSLTLKARGLRSDNKQNLPDRAASVAALIKAELNKTAND